MKIENLCINCMKERAHGEGPCEHCGFDPAAVKIPAHHLAPFTILEGKYLVGRAIGEGGFGITYIGMDLNLELRVAIKEYYPNGCAIRDMSGNSGTVQSYAGDAQTFFETGREKFINEAKTLAKCVDFPEIVTVKDFFKENHTAYIVMEYLEGETLKAYLKRKGGKISTAETLNMMRPLIQSLGKVHKMNLIHRDISPDNIMLMTNGKVKILDFGGARDFVSAGGRSMSIMLKPGYAPEEQYRTHGEQGPWTDVYAMCATMYRCITGQIPPESMERTYKDELLPVTALAKDCPPEIDAAIRKGLSVYKDHRFLSMEALYDSLYNGVVVTPPGGSGQNDHKSSNHTGYSSGQGNVRSTDHVSRSGAGPAAGQGSGRRTGSGPGTERRSSAAAGNREDFSQNQEKTSSKLPVLAGILGVVLVAFVAIAAVKVVIPSLKDNNSGGNTDVEVTSTPVPEATSTPVPEATATPTPTPEPTATPTPIPVVNKIDMTHIENNLMGGRGSHASETFYIYDCQQDAGRGSEFSDTSTPASALISVPILYTAAVQMDEGILSMNTTVPFEYSFTNGRGTLSSSMNGQNVSVQELLQSMLMYSDNNAINTMINLLSLDGINQACNDAGYSNIRLERKLINGSSPLNNYISAKDVVMMLKDLYTNQFTSINRDYLVQYMRVTDKAGRLGFFQTDELYNGGSYCNQNGIVPSTSSGRYTEAGIVFADGKEYIIAGTAESGNADVAASELSDIAVYVHSCMKEG